MVSVRRPSACVRRPAPRMSLVRSVSTFSNTHNGEEACWPRTAVPWPNKARGTKPSPGTSTKRFSRLCAFTLACHGNPKRKRGRSGVERCGYLSSLTLRVPLGRSLAYASGFQGVVPRLRFLMLRLFRLSRALPQLPKDRKYCNIQRASAGWTVFHHSE